MKHLVYRYLLLCCLFICFFSLTLGGTKVAFAQDDEDEFTLEEITVTAEKREAELQKVPMEISVLRMDQMREMNVNQVYDLEKILPDISTSHNVGNYILVSIREVTTGQWNPMFETTVATHIDGVQLTRFGGLENFFFDLERVEVLKGPQGTLYGRGSTAGSINMITKKPVLNEFGGNAELEVGNYGLYRGDLAINIPIVDKVAMRLAGRIIKRDGYSDSGYSDANSRSGRMSVLWEPSDRLTFTAIGDWQATNDNGMAMVAAGSGGPSGFYLSTYGDVSIVENELEPNPPYTDGGGPLITRWKSRWAIGDMLDMNFNDSDHYGVTAILDYEFDLGTLTAQFGHRDMYETKVFMWGGVSLRPYPYVIPTTPTSSSTTYLGEYPITQVAVRAYAGATPFSDPITSSQTHSYEIRFASASNIPAGDKFEWIVGAMGQDDSVLEYTSFFWVKVDTRSRALFGQASWMPIDKWNLTAGYRYNYDKKYYLGINPWPWLPDYSDRNRDPSLLGHGAWDWTEGTYKANLSYIPTGDIMTYLQYSKGYRTGNVGFDGRPNTPEILGAWELGFKSRWLQNRLQFNATAYFYNYRNYNSWANVSRCRGEQYEDHTCEDVWTAPTSGLTGDEGTPGPDGVVDSYDEEDLGYTSFSPGGAEQMGISIDSMWMITMNDILSIAATWRKNEYKDPYNTRLAILEIYPDAVSVWREDADDQSGLEFGGAPIRGNIGYTHTWYIGSDVLTANTTAFYNGKGIDQWLNYGTDDQYKMPGREAFWTFDLSATYSSSRWLPNGMNWQLRFRASNIFDNDALDFINYTDDIFMGVQNAYPAKSGIISGNFINPRTYSVSIRINF